MTVLGAGLSGFPRLRVTAAWGFAVALVVGAAPATRANEPGPDPPPGPVIRNIRVERSPIFSEEDRARLHWLPLGFLNRLHINTREGVIRRELVFEAGERLQRDEIEESARKLRGTGFFGDAWIDEIVVAPDSVDIVVRTRELWTTALNFEFERFEDEVLWAAEIREKNFLGMARSFRVRRNVDVDRSTWSFGIGDRQLFDGRWRGRLEFSESDDGSNILWQIGQPFFSLGSKWSMGLSYQDFSARPRYYIQGNQYIRPRADFTDIDLSVARLISKRDGGVWRAGVGFLVNEQRFFGEDGLEVSDAEGELGFRVTLAPDVREDRDLRMPYVVLSRATRRFTRHRYLFAMGKIEDLPLGFEHRFELGWAMVPLGTTDPGVRFETSHQLFTERDGFLYRVQVRSRGLLRSPRAQNVRLEGAVSSYRRLTHSVRLALGLTGGTSSDLDRSSVFTLGVDSGLRAARFREFAGDRVLRGNVELRWVYTAGFLDLVTPGLTAFADFGQAWFERERDFRWEGVRGAAGVGLRLGLNRAAEEVPIRVDIAWPLLYDNERGGAVLSVGTGQIF